MKTVTQNSGVEKDPGDAQDLNTDKPVPALQPRNWQTFQHYKKRQPPWIKLHHGLLDDYDFQRMPAASRALAPMLWLLASESITGAIPYNPPQIAFRLHLTEKELTEGLSPLISEHFFEITNDASDVLADCKQTATSETEAEAETKTDVASSETKLPPDYCPQCAGIGFIGSDYKRCPDCNGSWTKPSQKKTKPADPRHKSVVDAYATEFESRRGVKPLIDGSDGKQLSALLRQQSDATAETIVTWLKDAFESDDVPPLRPGFRLREFCSHALKFTDGPLKRNGKTPATSKHVGLDKIDHFAGLGPQNENGSYKF